jgi:periplasmic protein CpxP/Spy
MKFSSTRQAILAGIALSLAIGGAGFAQGQYGGPPSGPPGANGAPSQPPMSQAAYMSQVLGLRSDQQPALQTFLAAVAAPSGVVEKMRAEDARMATLPTPQRLDMMLSRMDESRSLMVERIAATKRFYAQLTPAQQHTFDTLGNQGGQNRGGPSR